MDTLLLSRIQFGLSAGIHFIMPVTTLGLAFYITVCEGLFLKTGRELYRRISTLGVRILAFVFALGVATGIILPFAFGSNWSNFVSFASSVFGVHLTIETVVAFMLESVFLGVLLFGRERVGKTTYFLAALMVFLGSHLSAFFIISANSWLQTPFHSLETLAAGIPQAGIDGFHLVQLADGSSRIVMDDVGKVIFNPSTVVRFLHTITACWLCGAVVMAAVAASHLRRHPAAPTARKALGIALAIGIVTALAQPVIGHQQIMTVLTWQPAKDAAMEGIFQTQKGAPLYALGIVDETRRTTYGIGMPFGLSFLETFRLDGEVKGLDDVLAEGQANPNGNPNGNWKSFAPPVQAVFQLFHLMVTAGILLIAGLALAVFFHVRKLPFTPWLGRILIALVPLPYIAVEAGWINAEIGRQPWIIFGLLPTAQGVSVLPVEYVGFSLVLLCVVWLTLAALAVRWLPGVIRDGLAEGFGGDGAGTGAEPGPSGQPGNGGGV
jgi:cytochrome d ubiquinol oxidase subunit I